MNSNSTLEGAIHPQNHRLLPEMLQNSNALRFLTRNRFLARGNRFGPRPGHCSLSEMESMLAQTSLFDSRIVRLIAKDLSERPLAGALSPLALRTCITTQEHQCLRARWAPIHGIAFVGEANGTTEATIAEMGQARRLGRLPRRTQPSALSRLHSAHRRWPGPLHMASTWATSPSFSAYPSRQRRSCA